MRQIGRYLVIRELGHGAMGVVFEARDPLIRRNLAIKVIHLDGLRDRSDAKGLQERLFREARSAGVLSHPGIVVVHDVGAHENAPYIAMELVDGPTLEHVLHSRRPDLQEALSILRQTASALDHAHENGVIHRDIKPGNLMLHKGTILKITDFGIAKVADTQNRTRTGTVIGTPSYMSPEQITATPLDGRSDQFSLAVISFEMLTGRKPFAADSLPGLVHQIVYEERPSARKWRPDLPQSLEQVLNKGLSRNSADRFPTCQGFVDAIESALQASAPSSAAEIAVRIRGPREADGQDLPSTLTFPEAVPRPFTLSLDSPVFWTASRMAWTGAICLVIVLAIGGVAVMQRTAARAPQPQALKQPVSSLQVPISQVSAPVAESVPVSGQLAKPPLKPGIGSFTADRTSVEAGQQVVLKWLVSNATEVQIAPGVGPVDAQGSRRVRVSSDTEYSLVATGSGGEAVRRLKIAIARGPVASPGVSFTSDLDSIKPGQLVYLRWSTPAATEVFIDQLGRVDRAGSQQVSPATTTSYKLTAKGPWGETTRSLTIGVDTSAVEARRAWDTKDWARVRSMADGGNAEGQYYLGVMYSTGQGVAVDNSQAGFWYRKAADQGHPLAEINLGNLYQSGLGMPRDDAAAVAWYREAADQGNAQAQSNLAFMYSSGRGVTKDDAQALAWYRKGADQDYAPAEFNVGLMYAGGRGVTKDDVQAVAWYRKAADHGYAIAQSNLGYMYSYGRGIPKDDVQAVVWYRKAADQNYSVAQSFMGLMYASGRGVPKDDALAAAWYQKAANQGHPTSQYTLGDMYRDGLGVPRDDTQAVAWYRKAADQGSAMGQYSLGFMYENGRGVLKDEAQAIAWYRKAADQSHGSETGRQEATGALKRLGVSQ